MGVLMYYNTDCYQLGVCYSKSLPSVDNFVGREEDIRNITGYLDFTTSDVQVVHIVGPPGFGKSTLAKKVGEMLVRRWIKVFYVDLGMVRDINTLSERVMMSIVDDMKYEVSLNRVVKWVRNQNSNTLIILDNCDELFEYSKEEILQAIKSLKEASSRKNVRYILTSQKWEADIGNFRLHAIYNLSSVAAIELLDRLAPSLTDNQKMQIADLTGNVPLALAVVGAIFKFPDAPTPEEVIEGLKENLVGTLSPAELHSKVDGSISLAYHYLTPELKELCVNLSHFPGSFDRASAVAIFDFRENMLEMLVQRSLLQYERNVRRFYFHLLLKTFFLQVNNEEAETLFFNDTFLLYFARELHSAIPDYYVYLHTVHEETHNIAYMFILLTSHTNVNTTYFAIKVLSHELRTTILMRFIPPDVFLFMLYCLDSYFPEERDSVESFLDTYIQVVMLVTKLESQVSISLNRLVSKRKEVDRGYKQGNLTLSTFVKYFIMLGEIYKMNGDEKNWRHCHAHILTKTKGKLKDCYPQCDYFSISIAYESVGDKVQAFHFRKLAYRHQFTLTPMNMIKLLLLLHNDYSNTSLGNDVTEAEALSLSILKEYPVLMNAENSEYSEDNIHVYYLALVFYREQNLERNVVELQKNIISRSTPCSQNDKYLKMGKLYPYVDFVDPPNPRPHEYVCALNFGDTAMDAFHDQYYHLAIWCAKQSIASSDKLGESYTVLKCAPLAIIGISYYHMGNNSAARIWLNDGVQETKNALKSYYLSFPLRKLKLELGFCLLLSGEVLSIFCFIYDSLVILLIHLSFFGLLGPCFICKYVMELSEVNLSSSTAVIELKHTYIWNFASKNIDINNTIQQFTNTVLGVITIIVASCYYLFLITIIFNAVVFCFYNGIPFRKIMKLLVVIFLLAIIDFTLLFV